MAEKVRSLGIMMGTLHQDNQEKLGEIAAWVRQGVVLLGDLPKGMDLDNLSHYLAKHTENDYGHIEQLLRTQRDENARLFAKKLGMIRAQYLRWTPDHLPNRPSPELGEFVPVIVQPPVPNLGLGLEEILDAYKLGREGSGNFFDWPEDPQGFQTPEAPYAAYVSAEINMEQGYKARSTREARKRIIETAEIRGATIYESLAYLHHYQQRFLADQHAIHCPNTSYESVINNQRGSDYVGTVEPTRGEQVGKVNYDAETQGPGLFIAQFSLRDVVFGLSLAEDKAV